MAQAHAIGKVASGFMRSLILVALLSGAACADNRAPDEGGTVVERVTASTNADPIAFSSSVEAVEGIKRHMALSAELESQPSSKGMCALARSAQALVPLLADSFGAQQAALLSGDDALALDALGQQMEDADRLLVGIGLRLGAEVVYSHVRYDEIADMGVSQTEAAALFRAVSGLWRKPTGWPVHVQQQTDTTGCYDPGALIAPLETLVSAWNDAPECARKVVADVVRDAIRDALSDASCYCAAQDVVVADATRLAGVAKTIGASASGSETDALSVHLRGGDARFECLAN